MPVIAEQQTWDVDEVCAAAVDRARDALLEEADAALIGEHTDSWQTALWSSRTTSKATFPVMSAGGGPSP